jgi:hypothetical protein
VRLATELEGCDAEEGRVTGGQVVEHILVRRVDLGALGEELVDEAELAELRRHVEGGPAILLWGSGGCG